MQCKGNYNIMMVESFEQQLLVTTRHNTVVLWQQRRKIQVSIVAWNWKKKKEPSETVIGVYTLQPTVIEIIDEIKHRLTQSVR